MQQENIDTERCYKINSDPSQTNSLDTPTDCYYYKACNLRITSSNDFYTSSSDSDQTDHLLNVDYSFNYHKFLKENIYNFDHNRQITIKNVNRRISLVTKINYIPVVYRSNANYSSSYRNSATTIDNPAVVHSDSNGFDAFTEFSLSHYLNNTICWTLKTVTVLCGDRLCCTHVSNRFTYVNQLDDNDLQHTKLSMIIMQAPKPPLIDFDKYISILANKNRSGNINVINQVIINDVNMVRNVKDHVVSFIDDASSYRLIYKKYKFYSYLSITLTVITGAVTLYFISIVIRICALILNYNAISSYDITYGSKLYSARPNSNHAAATILSYSKGPVFLIDGEQASLKYSEVNTLSSYNSRESLSKCYDVSRNIKLCLFGLVTSIGLHLVMFFKLNELYSDCSSSDGDKTATLNPLQVYKLSEGICNNELGCDSNFVAQCNGNNVEDLNVRQSQESSRVCGCCIDDRIHNCQENIDGIQKSSQNNSVNDQTAETCAKHITLPLNDTFSQNRTAASLKIQKHRTVIELLAANKKRTIVSFYVITGVITLSMIRLSVNFISTIDEFFKPDDYIYNDDLIVLTASKTYTNPVLGFINNNSSYIISQISSMILSLFKPFILAKLKLYKRQLQSLRQQNAISVHTSINTSTH